MRTTPWFGLTASAILSLMFLLPGRAISPTIPTTNASNVQAMPLISRNVATGVSAPAYASSGTAADGISGDYSAYWSPSATTCWLAYDLSGVPSSQRERVLVAWYNDPYTSDYWQGGSIGNSYYNLPQNYTIEGNAAPGGNTAPMSGWVTLVTITGNSYSGRMQVVDMTGYTWLRLNITKSTGGSPVLKMDVYDASLGQQDTYLMLGDSITAEAMAHSNIDLSGSWNSGNLTQLVNVVDATYYPSILDGGTGGVTAEWGATYISSLLAPYSGRFVALNYGTNDANQSGALTADQITSYYNSLLIMVDAIQSRGMVAIVPHIPWGCASSGWLGTNAKTLNDYVDAHLFVDRPGVIRGPDLWTFFYNNQYLLQDCIHPTYTESNGQLSGYEQLQRQWRNALLANVYNATPTGSPTRVTTTVPSVSPTASSTTTPTQSPLPTSTPTPTVPSASPTATSTATPSPSPAPTSTTTPTSGQINWVRGAYISPAGTTSSPSVTLSGVSAGDLLVVSLDIGGGKMETATNGVTSNGPSSLSWSQVVSDVHGQSQVNLWYAFAPMSGTYSITGHATAPTAMSMAIDEYSGVNHSAPVLTWGSGGGFSTMPSAASSTPVAAGSLILGSVTWDSGNKVLTVGTGFSARQTVTNGNKYQPLGIEDQVSATSATPQVSWMFNSSASWTAAMVVFGR